MIEPFSWILQKGSRNGVVGVILRRGADYGPCPFCPFEALRFSPPQPSLYLALTMAWFARRITKDFGSETHPRAPSKAKKPKAKAPDWSLFSLAELQRFEYDEAEEEYCHPDHEATISFGKYEQLKADAVRTEAQLLAARWRQNLASGGSVEGASAAIMHLSPLGALLMPIFQAERYPPVNLLPAWNDDEEALWDYLELVGLISQPHFLYPNAGLIRVPSALFELSCIEELNLSENKLVTLPPLTLPNLRRLFLHHNYIKIIPDLGNCPSLEVLDIRVNQLSTLPRGLAACQRLRHLDADYNQLKSFEEVTQCLALEFIHLNHNQIRNVPADLYLLKDIEYFQLLSNPITNLPAHIYKAGKCAILSYSEKKRSDNVSGMRTEFLDLLNSGDSELADLEIVATKEPIATVIQVPDQCKTEINAPRMERLLALVALEASSVMTVPKPSSFKVYSTIMLARVPVLRPLIIQALAENKNATLHLDITPFELDVLMKYVYVDVLVISPWGTALVDELMKDERDPSIFLTNSLLETFNSRHLIEATTVMDLANRMQLPYLATLVGKAMDELNAPAQSLAQSTFLADFTAILPQPEASLGDSIEWNSEEVAKKISQGFSQLAHQSPESPLLHSSEGIARASTGHSDPRAGLKYAVFAPNDIAFRVVSEPDAPLIGAHRTLLCIRSKYLRNMLTGGLMESTQAVIDMVDISYDSLKAIVEFCYTDGITEIHGDMIMELLMKARLFGLDSLQEYVESIVGYSLDLSNLMSIISVAGLYELTKLLKAAKFFVLSNWPLVTKLGDWQTLDPKIREKFIKAARKNGIPGA